MHVEVPTESRVEQIVGLAQLSMTSERDGDIHTLGLAGEVDLAGVPFIDSTGIKVLISAARRSQSRNRLLLDCPSPAVLRVLRIAGVADLLPLVG